MSDQPSVLKANGINFRNQKEDSTRLRHIRKRASRCVCKYCGQVLSLRKITYATYDETKIEVYCDSCHRIEYGAEPEIYKIASYYIDALRYDHYPGLDNSERKRRMNIAVICDILTWGFKNAGLLGEDGFESPIHIDEDMLGQALTIADRNLSAFLKE